MAALMLPRAVLTHLNAGVRAAVVAPSCFDVLRFPSRYKGGFKLVFGRCVVDPICLGRRCNLFVVSSQSDYAEVEVGEIVWEPAWRVTGRIHCNEQRSDPVGEWPKYLLEC